MTQVSTDPTTNGEDIRLNERHDARVDKEPRGRHGGSGVGTQRVDAQGRAINRSVAATGLHVGQHLTPSTGWQVWNEERVRKY